MSKVEETSDRRVGLADELDLARAVLVRTATYWNTTLEDSRASEESRLLCERLIRECTESVAKIVGIASRVRLMEEGSLQLRSVEWVVGKVCEVIETQIRAKNPELADKIVDSIKNIRLPQDGNLSKFMSQASQENFM